MANDWSAEELEAVLYAPEVEQAISEVFPSSDPLDAKDFNPIDYINELFPTEQSLAGVDDNITRMKIKVRQLDDEIRTVVREQAESGHDGRQALEEAQQAIQELFGRIRNIKAKAEHSELMVKKITGDIKQMDIAKKHLTDSIRTLERLRLLIINLEEIENNARLHQYAQVASQLRAAEGVVEDFTCYQSIPQIKFLIDRLVVMKRDIAAQIKVGFEKAFSIKGTAGGAKNELHEACLVLDALGESAKEELIQWFIKMQLSDYDMLFHESLEPSWLDKVDRRYAWLKRALVNYDDESAAIFPADWAMPERICIEFCHRTKKSLSVVMKARSENLVVKLLLFAIQKTTGFEKFLAQKFSSSSYMEALMPPKPVKDTDENDEPVLEAQHMKLAQDSSPFLGMISRCFEPHLTVYIQSQDGNLAELLEKFVGDLKSFNPGKDGVSGTAIVFPTAADLFVFYKKCLVQCASLSTGPPLLQLTEVFQKYLREYANRILGASLPKIQSSSSGGAKLSLTVLKREVSPDIRLTTEELAMTCSVLCTADYCMETTQQLESKLKEKVDQSLASQVDLGQEQEMFRNLASSSIQLLVQDSESACISAFNAMVKIPWGTIEAVGDQSPYVSQVVGHLRSTIPLVRENLSSTRKYFINFFHKFANVFIPAFITHLYKCKPVSTIAAEQLLLDTHSLKTCLLELPSVGAAVMRKAPTSYIKLVNKGMEKAELIVKIVMSPHEQAEEFVDHYLCIMQGVGDIDPGNFQKILEMKGLKRTEQHALIELFKAKVATSSAGNKSNTSPAAATNVPTSLSGIIGGERGLLGMRKLEMGLEKFMTRTRTATEFMSSSGSK